MSADAFAGSNRKDTSMSLLANAVGSTAGWQITQCSYRLQFTIQMQDWGDFIPSLALAFGGGSFGMPDVTICYPGGTGDIFHWDFGDPLLIPSTLTTHTVSETLFHSWGGPTIPDTRDFVLAALIALDYACLGGAAYEYFNPYGSPVSYRGGSATQFAQMRIRLPNDPGSSHPHDWSYDNLNSTFNVGGRFYIDGNYKECAFGGFNFINTDYNYTIIIDSGSGPSNLLEIGMRVVPTTVAESDSTLKAYADESPRVWVGITNRTGYFVLARHSLIISHTSQQAGVGPQIFVLAISNQDGTPAGVAVFYSPFLSGIGAGFIQEMHMGLLWAVVNGKTYRNCNCVIPFYWHHSDTGGGFPTTKWDNNAVELQEVVFYAQGADTGWVWEPLGTSPDLIIAHSHYQQWTTVSFEERDYVVITNDRTPSLLVRV